MSAVASWLCGRRTRRSLYFFSFRPSWSASRSIDVYMSSDLWLTRITCQGSEVPLGHCSLRAQGAVAEISLMWPDKTANPERSDSGGASSLSAGGVETCWSLQ